MSRNPLTPIIAVFYLLVIGVAVAWSFLFNDLHILFLPPVVKAEGLEGTQLIWVLMRHILLGGATGLLVVLLTTLATDLFDWAKHLEREFREILGPLSRDEVFFLAFASGLGEELLFRGALQETWGLVPASLVFGLLHVGPNRRYVPWTIYAIGAGLLFGTIYERGGLVPVVVAHIVVNLISLQRINRRRR